MNIKTNILYICTPNSIHDIKWMRFFSEQTENYNVYAIGERQNHLKEDDALLKTYNINLLNSIHSFTLKNIFRTIESILMLKKVIKHYKIDVVHILFTTPYSIWLNFIYTPTILTTRGSDVLVVLPALLSQPGIKRLYFNFLFKLFDRSFHKAKFVTCTSNGQIQKLKQLFQLDQCQLVRTGVDVDRIHEIEKPDLIHKDLIGKKYVLSPRFMAPIYNIHFQIEALSLLNSSVIENYIFVFIKGKAFDEVYFNLQKERLENLKIEKKVNFLILEYLDQESLWMHMKKSSLVMMTPISDGTPNSALEAMAAFVPLIISDLPIYDDDLFANTCTKVSLEDTSELSYAIENSLDQIAENKLLHAFETVKEKGNRKQEMEKIQYLYKTITNRLNK